MFEYFKQAKAIELKALERLAANGRLPLPLKTARPGFAAALKQMAAKEGLAVIAEYKRASPSQGNIALTVAPENAAKSYGQAGAAAISVLTEKSKFKGRLAFIKAVHHGGAAEYNLPVLRKDFIFHPLQVEITASVPASALLLIVKLTPSAQILRDLREQAEKYGLEAVVEILDEADLKLARDSGASIIQTNARDFTDLSVDLERSFRLARKHRAERPDETWIAASGFSSPLELKQAAKEGFTAILAGTALMNGGNLKQSLTELKSCLSLHL